MVENSCEIRRQRLCAPFFERGLTLIELMVVVSLIGVIMLLAMAGYRYYVRQTRLQNAKTALLLNSQAIERYYAQHKRIKINSRQWMPLPHTNTGHFCIRMQGNPRGTNSANYYTMKAVAFDKNYEPRVVKINQDLTVSICQRSTSTCNDPGDFFRGGSSVDRQCKPF